MTNFKKPELIKDLGRIYPTKKSKHKTRYGIYKCSCGKEFRAQTNNVNSGNTISCGCYHKKIITKHNMWGTQIYKAWDMMKGRCNRSSFHNYKNWGGRGITYDPRWEQFENFYEDMKDTFQDGLSLDRINNDGNYCKENCRWATRLVQNSNTRLLCSRNTSGYRGVSFFKQTKKWRARVNFNKKCLYSAYFDDKIEAAQAYDNFIIENNLPHTRNFS